MICPGGGYMKLCMDYEGYDAARWFAANGVTAAVLKYRLPEGHPEVPLEDAVQALRIMAGLEAGATGYTADRVGIAGFSAGGHLAAAVSTLGTFKPAFSILFYPVTGDGESPGCRITFDRLLGGRRTDAAVAAAWSPSRQVTAETPPALLFHSDDDATVPALKQHGLLRRPETVRHRGLAAHLPLGRTRLGPARLLPLPGDMAARRTRLARPPLRRPGRGAPPLKSGTGHCRLPNIAYLCANKRPATEPPPV